MCVVCSPDVVDVSDCIVCLLYVGDCVFAVCW